MTITTSRAEIMILAMKNKLRQAYRFGEYECEVIYSEEVMHCSLISYAVVKGQKVEIAHMYLPDEIPAHMLWLDLGDLMVVTDETMAKIMLLYGV